MGPSPLNRENFKNEEIQHLQNHQTSTQEQARSTHPEELYPPTTLNSKILTHFLDDGYKLNFMGYDYLALKVFLKRGHIERVIHKVGVGKESGKLLTQNLLKSTYLTGL